MSQHITRTVTGKQENLVQHLHLYESSPVKDVYESFRLNDEKKLSVCVNITLPLQRLTYVTLSAFFIQGLLAHTSHTRHSNKNLYAINKLWGCPTCSSFWKTLSVRLSLATTSNVSPSFFCFFFSLPPPASLPLKTVLAAG